MAFREKRSSGRHEGKLVHLTRRFFVCDCCGKEQECHSETMPNLLIEIPEGWQIFVEQSVLGCTGKHACGDCVSARLRGSEQTLPVVGLYDWELFLRIEPVEPVAAKG